MKCVSDAYTKDTKMAEICSLSLILWIKIEHIFLLDILLPSLSVSYFSQNTP